MYTLYQNKIRYRTGLLVLRLLVLRRSNNHQGLEWENSKHPNGKRPEQVVDDAGTITRAVGRSMKIHWFVQLIFFLFVCIFSYVDRRSCILSYFDIKCTCIVHTCHIVCSDTIYNTRWLPGFARVPYYAPSPCHMHPGHNCRHIKSCPPPDKQYTEFIIYTCSLFFI